MYVYIYFRTKYIFFLCLQIYLCARAIFLRTSFSSRCRPPVAIVQEAMEELQKNGLGIFKIVEKLKVFYKQSPEMDLQPKLAKYGISLEEFTRTFNQEDDRLTSQNEEAIAEQSPFDYCSASFISQWFVNTTQFWAHY